jgi:hypothetical protein
MPLSAASWTVPAPAPSFNELRVLVDAFAVRHHLLKVPEDRMAYRQVPGCPCAYVEWMGFDELVQQVLDERRDRPFRVQHVRDAKTYLVNFDPPAFQDLHKDRRLLSFRNGVLVLPEARFVPVRDGVVPPELEGRVARHHVDLEYTGGRETPLMDALVEAVLGDATDDATAASRRDTLYVLLGRLLFQVRELDDWQVVPLLLGGGGGAAAVLHVVEAMFAPAAVGCGYANRRIVGGGDGGGRGCRKRSGDKDVLIVHHAATQLKRMPKCVFTTMVSGETQDWKEPPDPWRTPMLIASDRRLHYEDEAGEMRWRVVPFYCCDASPDAPTASEVIEELPNVIARCLTAYLDAVTAAQGHGFWAYSPESLRLARTQYSGV